VARRTVWLMTGVVAGAASSLYAERKLRRTLEVAQARLQPDALVVEVGRTARQAATSTGGRVRDAVTTARLEKRRREDELWEELGQAPDGRPPDEVADGGTSPLVDGVPPGPAQPPVRRSRRAARRRPSHLGR